MNDLCMLIGVKHCVMCVSSKFVGVAEFCLWLLGCGTVQDISPTMSTYMQLVPGFCVIKTCLFA